MQQQAPRCGRRRRQQPRRRCLRAARVSSSQAGRERGRRGRGRGGNSGDLLSGFRGSQEQDAVPSLLLRSVRLWRGDTAQIGESQASNSCCSAGPPQPPSPRSPAVHLQPAQGPPGSTPRELGKGTGIAAPSSLSVKSWPGIFPACWGRGPTSDKGLRGGMCVCTSCS